MPTQKKVQSVDQIKGWFESATITISTDHTGIGVSQMTELRRSLRESGVEFRVIKNSLAYLAADAAEKPWYKEIVQGPTALALGYGEPTETAKALSDFIRRTRSPLTIRGAAFGEQTLTGPQVEQLATIPSKDVLIGQLMGQFQAPITGLARVLNGPVAGLARVLNQIAEAQGQTQTQEA